jgi:hypothetical protein
MTAPPLIFVGPSLAGSGLPLPDGIELRPPARRGDLLRAASRRPEAIGLIDGLFETAPAVWHKEILQVMAEGVPVYGAASLGALRAAELGALGMIGIGAIYAAYCEGRIERDDAVMVSHAPAELGHRPLTLALVDAEAAIARATMAADDRAVLFRLARHCNFRDRTWRTLLDAFERMTGNPRPAIDQHHSLKRDDAEALVRVLAGPIEGVDVPPPPQTCFLRSLRETVMQRSTADRNGNPPCSVPQETIRARNRLAGEEIAS